MRWMSLTTILGTKKNRRLRQNMARTTPQRTMVRRLVFETLECKAMLSAAPVATDNGYEAYEDGGVAGNMITDDTGNGIDSGGDGTPLELEELMVDGVQLFGGFYLLSSGATLSLSGAGDGGFFSYSASAAPAFQALAAGDQTTDSFQYTITDGTSVSNAATVTITINGVNDAPTDIALSASPVVENDEGAIIGDLTVSDVDNGDIHSFAVSDGRFEVVNGQLKLKDGVSLDYEIKQTVDVEVTATDLNGDGLSVNQTFTINVLNVTAMISGTVYVDANQNGLFDGSETGIDGVTVELYDADRTSLLATDTTELGGVYAFEVDDEFGTYRIVETQPTGVVDGAALLGDAGGTVISSNEMQLTLTGSDASDYDFTEIGQSITSGDTATIGFWQNKNGQALIEAGGTELANWLTDNFGNVFGDTFVGGDGGDVADFYKTEFFKKKLTGTPKVDAQFMAVAFATYFTSTDLSGATSAASYGFNVTDTGIGTKVVNVGDSGEAFNVDDGTDMTIMAMLLATNSLTDIDGTFNNDSDGYSHVYDKNGDGILDADELLLRVLANEVFTAINEQGDI
jgi:VCBS repeat-containing protein